MTVLLTALAMALIVAAVALLYLKWQGRPWPWAVPAAWGALIVSAGLWMTAYTPDYGLPFGFLVAMSLPLLLIASRIDWKVKPEKQRRVKAAPDLPDHWTPRRIGRIAARLVSSLVLAPVIGMAVAITTWIYLPGHEADRYALAVFLFNFVSAVALVIALAAQRPWRALGLIAVATAALSGLAALPLLTGSVA